MADVASGKLWTYLLNAILIAVPASFIVLAWYRHAVSQMMRVAHAADVPIASDYGSPAAVSPASDVLSARNTTPNPALKETRGLRRRRLAIIYGVAGGIAAGIMAILFFASMQFDIRPRGAFAAWYVFAWPIIPTGVVLLALPQSRNVLFLLGYAALGAALIFVWAGISAWVPGDTVVQPLQSAMGLLNLLIRQMWLPYLIILFTGNRRLRSVSPLVPAGLLVFSFSSLVARDLYIAAVDRTPLGPWLLFPGSNTYSLWYLIAVLPIGYVCWVGLQSLARAYQAKRFSDVQFLLDAWWVLVTFQFCTELASDFGWYGLSGLLAFIGYRGLIEVGLRRWPLDASSRRGPGLLLLRVFGFQRRTEGLFDAIAQQWRFTGHVMMIVGADVAMRTLDPGDTVSFVGGRLKTLFISDEENLRRRLSSIDMEADPDGRFRVNKYFCYEDTWRPTLVSVLLRSQVVLMDLRGFTKSNQGIVFELEQLITQDALSRTLMVVDDTTDVALLNATVQQQARSLGRGVMSSVHIRHVKKRSRIEMQNIYETLGDMAQASMSQSH